MSKIYEGLDFEGEMGIRIEGAMFNFFSYIIKVLYLCDAIYIIRLYNEKIREYERCRGCRW